MSDINKLIEDINLRPNLNNETNFTKYLMEELGLSNDQFSIIPDPFKLKLTATLNFNETQDIKVMLSKKDGITISINNKF